MNSEKIHILACCGTGTASLAGLLAAQGHEVSGCDQGIYPPMSDVLPQWGVELLEGYRPDHLNRSLDRVIIGNAIHKENPEAQEALAKGLPYDSMASAIGRYLAEPRHSIVIAGTHGKTTTSALCGYLFEACGLDPTYLVGGILRHSNRSWRLGAGSHFIVEGDEYETAFFDKGPKFLHYHPRSLVINNLEFDHADNFENLDQMVSCFSRLVSLVKPGDVIFAGETSPGMKECLSHAQPGVSILSFGIHGEDVDVAMECLQETPEGSRFRLHRAGEQPLEGHSTLSGHHNLRNLAVAMVLALKAGAQQEKLIQACSSFSGIKRRQEVVSDSHDILVMDDFAHHPTAIEETLKALRGRYPKRRIMALVEPRSYTCQTRHHQDTYPTCFGAADGVAFAALPDNSKVPKDQQLDIPTIVTSLEKQGKIAVGPLKNEALFHWVQNFGAAGDLLVFMSSGSFEGLPHRLAKTLSEKTP